MKRICSNCRWFDRYHWVGGKEHGEQQRGGNCEVLLYELKHSNVQMILMDKLYVTDEFGCSFFSKREPV